MSDSNHLKRKSVEFSRDNSRYRFVRTIGVCIALVVLVTHLSHAAEWQPIDNTTDGIQIFKKETGGGSLVAFRGVGIVEAPLPLVTTVIFDTNRRLEWIDGLVDTRIIRWVGRDSFVEYDHIGMPPFITDRDFVSSIKMRFNLIKQEMIFHYQSSDDPSAPHTDYIRGSMIDTTFILTSFDNNKKTRIDAQFLCDPKGSIPRWLVNFFLKDWPKTTFRNLRKEVLKSDLSVDPRFSELLTRGIIDR